MKSQDDTVAVMVLYQPPESVWQAIDAILPQVKALVLVDNGENSFLNGGVAPNADAPPSALDNSSNYAGLRRLLAGEESSRTHYIKSPQNNLAMAQNLGIAKARELGAEFVLLMDDDSIPAADMVTQLRAAWQPGMGVVGPYLEEPELGRAPLYIQAVGKYGFRRVGFATPSSPESQRDSKAIQMDSPRIANSNSGNDKILPNLFYVAASGSLIPLSVMDAIGGMDEALGIYFVDTEFCLRARRAGYDVVAVKAAKLRHRFGKRSEHRLFGKTFSTTNHPPRARYWMARNRAKLCRDYWLSQPGYVLFDILRIESEIIRITLFEADKKAKLLAMWRGFSGSELKN